MRHLYRDALEEFDASASEAIEVAIIEMRDILNRAAGMTKRDIDEQLYDYREQMIAKISCRRKALEDRIAASNSAN